MFISKNSICHKKSIIYSNIFLSSPKKVLIKKTFKVTLQYLFNVFIQFNTVSFIKVNFELEIDPKMITFENLEEICKT